MQRQDIDTGAQDQLLASIQRILSPEQAHSLDETPTAEELRHTIRHLRLSSAPGLDGLSAAFYKIAPNVFGEILSIVFRYQFQRGKLLPSQRKAAVSLLHKSGSRSDPINYRPISMMQVDVKNVTSTLTYQMRPLMSHLIHAEQKGFIFGSSPHHHVRLLSDLQQLLSESDEDCIAVFLDFARAYDRVDWAYRFRILSQTGFGHQICSWVQVLYRNPDARFVLNGKLLAQ